VRYRRTYVLKKKKNARDTNYREQNRGVVQERERGGRLPSILSQFTIMIILYISKC
jgi:hypothetical protein